MSVYYSYMEEVRQKIEKIRHDSKEEFYTKIHNCWTEKKYDFLFEVFLKFKNQLIKIVDATKDGGDVLEMIEKTVDVAVFKDIVIKGGVNEIFYKGVFETLKHVYLSLFGKDFLERHNSTIRNGKFFTMCDEFMEIHKPVAENGQFVMCDEFDVPEPKEEFQPLDENVFDLEPLHLFEYAEIPKILLFVKNINLCLDAIYGTRKQMVTILKER